MILFFRTLILFFCTEHVWGLKITEFIGPSFVANGSVPLLVLDCPYELTREERSEETLDVKWFYRNIPVPIYQWIPGNKPQGLIYFKGRLDLEYEATRDHFSRHRALAIINPTVDVSGEYTCKVSTLFEEAALSKKILVYAPASRIKMKYERINRQTILVSCIAEDLYPRPHIALYRGMASAGSHLNNSDTNIEINSNNQTFRATVKYKLMKEVIDEEEYFLCVVNIPSTNYGAQKELIFFTEPPISAAMSISSKLDYRLSSILLSTMLCKYYF